MKRQVWIAIAIVLLMGATWQVVLVVRSAARAARISAQYALWEEIVRLLKEKESTGNFPRQLSDLPLTYPDGGDSRILALFSYERDATSCEVATEISGNKKFKRFEAVSGPP